MAEREKMEEHKFRKGSKMELGWPLSDPNIYIFTPLVLN